MSALFGIYLVFLVMRVFLAIIIFQKGRILKNKNLTELGITFFILSVSNVSILIDDLAIPGLVTSIVFNLSSLISIIIAIHWTDKVFYTNRKSPYKFLMAIMIPMAIANIILSTLNTYVFAEVDFIVSVFSSLLFGGVITIFGGWYFISARAAYLKIKSKENIEPWIKMRYKTIMLYSMCFLLMGISFGIAPLAPIEISAGITVPLFLIFITLFIEAIGEFLAWYMPDKLKNYYNRNYSVEETKELTEEEIMKQLGGD